MTTETNTATLNLQEAAIQLDVHVETLKRAIRAKKLSATLLGRRYRVTQTAIDAYVKSKTVHVEVSEG